MAGTGKCFLFEAGSKCLGGEGLYAFSAKRASEIFDMVARNINPGETHTHTQEPEVYPLPPKPQPKKSEKFDCHTKCAASRPRRVHFDLSLPDEEEPPPLPPRMAAPNDIMITATIPSRIVIVEATIEVMEVPPHITVEMEHLSDMKTQQTSAAVNMLDSYSTYMAHPNARSPGSTKTSQLSAAGYLPSHTTNSGSAMPPTVATTTCVNESKGVVLPSPIPLTSHDCVTISIRDSSSQVNALQKKKVVKITF